MILRLTLRERLYHRLHLLPTPVMDIFGSVLFGRALAIAVRRGMFEALAEEPLTPGALATRIGLHPEGATLLCDACVVAGYLRRRGSRYALAREGSKWLLAGSPVSLTHLIRYFEALHRRWGGLERSLERGAPEHPYYQGFSDEDWEEYVLAMRDLARLVMPDVARKLRFTKGASLLVDIGGAHGLYAIECCRRHPGLRAVIMDFPGATATAETIIRGAGMEGRVTLDPGDFSDRAIPAPADGALLFNIIHGQSEEQNRQLIQRVLAALRPGGRLYILDQMKGGGKESAVGEFIPLMIGLNLLNEIGGTSYAVDRVIGWCTGASSVRPRPMRLPGLTLIEVTR
jgi:hypothetical protein